MQRLSFATETVLSDKITRNRIVLSFTDSPSLPGNHSDDDLRVIPAIRGRNPCQMGSLYSPSESTKSPVRFDLNRSKLLESPSFFGSLWKIMEKIEKR